MTKRPGTAPPTGTPTGQSPDAKARKKPRSSWHRRAGKPVRFWMLMIIVAALVHPFVPEGRWLMVHLFTLGAATNSVLVWGQHFAERLLKVELPADFRRWQLLRIYLLNAGIVVTIGGKLGDIWPITTVGAAIIGLVVAWHAVVILRQVIAHRRSTYAVVGWHYVASACLLPIGAVFGALLASPVGDALHDRLVLAHELVNLVGFIGLAASGTLVTMFPAMWRTRMSRFSRPFWALGFQLAGIVVGAVSALMGVWLGASLGFALVAVGWMISALPWAHNIIEVLKDPRDRVIYPALSAAGAVVWLIASLLAAVPLAHHPAFTMTDLTLPLVIGFAAQLLLGVLSWVLPSTIGGGSAAVNAGLRETNRAGAFRFMVINLGLVLWLLPLPSWTKVAVSAAVGAALVAFLPLMVRSTKAQLQVVKRRARMKAEAAAGGGAAGSAAPEVPMQQPDKRPQPVGTQFAAAIGVLALILGLTGQLVGGGGGGTTAEVNPDIVATGTTVEATIDTEDMSFVPNVVVANVGDRVLLHVRNTDSQVHDLRLDTGAHTGRMAPGSSATVEIPVLPGTVEGWCTIAGHRQMGMTMSIQAMGSPIDIPPPSGSAGAGHGAHGAHMVADPDPESPTIDPALAPAENSTLHKVTLRASEMRGYIAPGVEQNLWTFNGGPVGPTLRGRVGDEFEVTLINDGTMSHSLDFHAGMVSPDEPMRQLAPGESLVYRFRAEHAGIWLYHCSTMPMSHHISAGMHGAVIIDPPDLAPVDHEFVMVQSEGYWGEDGPDPHKVAAETPDAYRFNGYPAQYVAHPIRLKAGETARFWVLAAGPNKGTSFHIVGTQFHRVYKEGALRLDDSEGGGQALDLAAAQGGYVEARFIEPGTYTFVDHQMVHAELGARGKIIVE